jgi:RNase P subunit RPR2
MKWLLRWWKRATCDHRETVYIGIDYKDVRLFVQPEFPWRCLKCGIVRRF